jgi:UPF0271 protein
MLRVEPLGDGAIRFARDPNVDARALLEALRAVPGVIDAIVTPAYACVTFDPGSPPDVAWDAIALDGGAAPALREHLVRVRYDGADLDEVAARAGLSREDVVRRHTARVYTVALVGFLPGFAYLGDVDEAIALPRRPSPRTRVPEGAVGVAARYTGIYPSASPGGWNLIGSAVDFHPFDPARGALLALGDRVRFEPVS